MLDEHRESLIVGGDHGASHPHLVHEFISGIVDDRPSSIDDIIGVTWAVAGICAHRSAVENGAKVTIPSCAINTECLFR